MVELLAELAGDGRALELGIGTGRIALPLARRGVPVHGIDLSEAMVAKLQAKPGAEEIGVTIGDFATTRVEGVFSVAFLVANTIMNLTTQEEQVACFRNVAAHLGPGGCFVIEVMVPRLRRLPPGETFQPFDVSPHHLGFDEYDVAQAGPRLPPLLDRGRRDRGPLAAVSLRLAVGARPHGAARRDDAARALGGLAARARSRARATSTSRCGRSRDARPAPARRRVLRVDAAPGRHVAARGRARRRGAPDGGTRPPRPELGGAGRDGTPLLALAQAAPGEARAGALARRRRRGRRLARAHARALGPDQVAERRDAPAQEDRRVPGRGCATARSCSASA